MSTYVFFRLFIQMFLIGSVEALIIIQTLKQTILKGCKRREIDKNDKFKIEIKRIESEIERNGKKENTVKCNGRQCCVSQKDKWPIEIMHC